MNNFYYCESGFWLSIEIKIWKLVQGDQFVSGICKERHSKFIWSDLQHLLLNCMIVFLQEHDHASSYSLIAWLWIWSDQLSQFELKLKHEIRYRAIILSLKKEIILNFFKVVCKWPVWPGTVIQVLRTSTYLTDS